MFDESLYVIQGAVKNEQEEYKLYCGLKKGEKLLEELSINKKLLKTKNKEIFLAKERNYETQLINDFVLKLKKSVYEKNDILLKKMIFSFLNKEK